MIRAELSEVVSLKVGLTKKEVDKIVNVVFGGIVDSLGKEMKIKASKSVSFKASANFKGFI